MTIFEKIRQGSYLLTINPYLFFKYFKTRFKRISPQWISSRPPGNTLKKCHGVFLNVDFQYLGWNSYTKQIYFDCYEIPLVEFMKKVLKKGDIFIDIGANIGYLTAIGASLVGKNGQVYSFEPAPQIFNFLKKIAKINPEYKIIANQYALGEKPGLVKMDFAKPPYDGGSTIVKNLLNKNIDKETIDVLLIRLDDYIKEKKINKISLIKIDVEGFELPVLKGLENYFKETANRPTIICEIAPGAYPLLGYKREELMDYMRKYGYEAYNIMNPRLRTDIAKFREGTNVVFKAVKI